MGHLKSQTDNEILVLSVKFDLLMILFIDLMKILLLSPGYLKLLFRQIVLISIE
jgi:hypothetical protein